jgi:hypothetical protein
MRECRSAIILQWAKQWIGIDLIARTIQITAAVVTAEVITKGFRIAAASDDTLP